MPVESAAAYITLVGGARVVMGMVTLANDYCLLVRNSLFPSFSGQHGIEGQQRDDNVVEMEWSRLPSPVENL